VARSSHLSRREGGRYYLQIRLKSFTSGSPSRLVRLSLETSDYAQARHRLADRMRWLLPLQTSGSSTQRYNHILEQLDAWNAQAPVLDRKKLSSRITFEHVVRGLIDDLGGLKNDGPFNAIWMTFCQENLAAQKRIDTQDRVDAYERGREDAIRALAAGRTLPQPAAFPARCSFDPTRPDKGIILQGLGNGRDTARTIEEVEETRDTALLGRAQVTPIAALEQSTSKKNDDAMVLSEFFTEFLEERRLRHDDDRAASEFGPIIEFAIALLGDKHPRAYTRDEFKHLNRAMTQIPTTKGIPASVGRSLIERYRYRKANPDKPLDLVTGATLKKNYANGLERFFQSLHNDGLMTLRPTFGLVTPGNRSSLPRDSFDDSEILDLLRLPLFTGCHSRPRCWTSGQVLVQGSLYWQYLILLMTGMRPSEVAPLRVRDIGVMDEFAYFDLRPFNARHGRVELSQMRTLKTGNAARLVPINPLLIELGLLDHRDEMVKAGCDRLLPDCEPYRKPDGRERWSQEISKSWQYVKNELNVVSRKDVTLYSTRHTMAQWIDELNISERTRRRVLGHADGSQAATNYGSKGLLSLDEFKAVSGISNPLLDKVRAILLHPKQAADRGELTLIRPLAPALRRSKDA